MLKSFLRKSLKDFNKTLFFKMVNTLVIKHSVFNYKLKF